MAPELLAEVGALLPELGPDMAELLGMKQERARLRQQQQQQQEQRVVLAR
jgi:ABC-type Fe3+/spermidine/putrescine transport system ATPase subunit